jgi:hypothetical protein
MATSQRIAGVVNITIDGVTYEVAAGAFEWSSYPVTRETLKSMSTNFPGYKELPLANFIAFTGRDNAAVPLSTYQNMTASTIVAILANGKVLTGTNMVCIEAVAVNSEDATIRLRFEGATVTEGLVS